MIVFPNAKINLGLRVCRKRPDGFHDIETVFLPIALRDALEILPAHHSSGSFSCTGFDSPQAPEQNLVWKAYQLVKTHFPEIPAVHIHLHKSIPAGAGLGGGSADASFTLLLLQRLFKLPVTEDQLQQWALQLGSDCPFFLLNKPCLGKGRGEILEPVAPDLRDYSLFIVNPGIHVSTAEAFAGIQPMQPADSLKDLIHLPPHEWQNKVVNDFEKTVFILHPEIAAIKKQLLQAGAVYAAMSGSGSTVFGLFKNGTVLPHTFPAHYFVRNLAAQSHI